MRVLAAPGPHARAPPGDAGGLRRSRRWPTTASPRSPATRRTGSTSPSRRWSRPRAARTTAPRSGSSAPTTRRCRPAGRRGRRQRAEPLPVLPRQRRPHARVADELGRLPHRRSRLPRRGRAPRVRRPQQGHHPPRRRHGRAGGARARAPASSGGPRRRRSCRCPTSASASGRAPRSSSSPGSARPTLAELQEFLEAEGVAKYTWPESIQVFDDFPRTPSLKVVKREVVRQIVERGAVPAGASAR